MFTKLKKKIAEEEISSDSSRSQPPSPVLSRVSSRRSLTNGDVGRPLKSENKWEKRRLSNASLYGSRESLSSERGSTVSRHSSFARVSSSPALSPMGADPSSGRRRSKPDDLVAMLNQKNEQVKQLEAKLADYEERLDDLTHSYEMKCSQLDDEYQQRMQEKNEELNEKLKALAVENCRRVDMSEVTQLQQEELNKMKEMFIQYQTDATRKAAVILEKSKQLENIDKAYADQRKELASLQDRLDDLSHERTRFEMREQQLKGQVTSLNQEKDSLRDQLNSTVSEFTQKTLQLNRIEKSCKESEEELTTVRQSFTFYKSKSTTELEEKQMLISQLKEKLENSKLSGSDQIKGVVKERELADQRLRECRQQLSELKAQSSDKFNTLGNLVSTLNERLDKKDAELTSFKKISEQEKDDLEEKARSLEERLKRTDELMSSSQSSEAEKVQTLQQRVLQLESDADSSRQQLTNTKRSYDDTIQSLEEQIKKLESFRAGERKDQQQKYDEFEQCRKEFIEMEEHYKEHISELEDEKFSLQEELKSKEEECRHVSSCLEDAMKEQMNSRVRFETMLIEKESAETKSSSSMYLGGDSELINSLRQELQETKVKCDHHEDELLDRNETILNLKQKIQEKDRQLVKCNEQIQEYEENNKYFPDSPNGAINNQNTKELYRQMASMRLQIRDLERQVEEKELTNGHNTSEVQLKLEAELEDRNKRIKLLQQKVIELKRAIQKDLKMSPPDDHTHPHQHSSRTRKDSETSTQSERDYDYLEINFKYLKHCILKYMCGTNQHSRQLITVIGHLLRFTRREELLVKDAAEWKLPID